MQQDDCGQGWIAEMSKAIKTTLYFFAALFSISPNTIAACEVVKIFSGGTLLSKAQMPSQKDYQGYDYFLVLNDDRDQSGMLNSFIKAKLVPARWGFDIETPEGKRVGQIMIHVRDPRLPRNVYEVTMDQDESCRKESIHLMQSGKSDLSASLNGKVIGRIQNRYPEAFR